MLQRRFLSLERGDLLLEACVFCFLVRKVSFHFFFNALELASQGFSDILSLHGQHALQRILFALQDLHFFFVEIHFICNSLYHFLQGFCTVEELYFFFFSALRQHTLPEN